MGRESRINQTAHFSGGSLYDAFGRKLQVGDTVHLMGRGDVMWEITHIRLMLEPGAPPNMHALTMVAVFNRPIQGGLRITDLLQVVPAPPKDLAGPSPETPPGAPPEDPTGPKLVIP